MHQEIAHLKAFIEGKPGLQPWTTWFEEHRHALERVLSRGQCLRLKFKPFEEIPNVLREQGLMFTPSDYYQWPEWDTAGPTVAPRFAPTSEHVMLVLKKFQEMLGELNVRCSDHPLFPAKHPSSIYVEQAGHPTIWLVEVDRIRSIAINARMPEEQIHDLPPPCFFRHGTGHFSFTPDCNKVLFHWLVGPTFGHTSVYDVMQASDGTLLLTSERMLCIF